MPRHVHTIILWQPGLGGTPSTWRGEGEGATVEVAGWRWEGEGATVEVGGWRWEGGGRRVKVGGVEVGG